MIIRIVQALSFVLVAILLLVLLSVLAPAGGYEVLIWSLLVIAGVVFIFMRPRPSNKLDSR